MSAPTPDSLQGPGFIGQLGNFFSGRRNEDRGRPELINGEWRVPKYDSATKAFIGYGTLDSQLDSRWNPGKLEADRQAGKEREARAEAKGLYETERARQWDVTNRQLQNQATASQNQFQLGMAGIQQQIASSKRQTDLALAEIRARREDAQDTNALNRYSIDQSTAVSREGLALKGAEIWANIALQQEQLAFLKKQLAQTRGANKLAFIGQAVQALLA